MSTNGRSIAIAFTGGVDSTVLAYEVATRKQPSNLTLLSCDYGQANWKITEKLGLLHAERLGAKFVRLLVTLPDFSCKGGLFEKDYKPAEANGPVFDYSDGKMSYENELVPYRNAFLFLWMMSWCQKEGVSEILTGHQYEDSEWENVESYRHRTEDFGVYFLDRINSIGELGAKKYIRINAPFIASRFNKKEICGLAINHPLLDLKNETYSCQYSPECGMCDNCVNRNRIFSEIGIV